MPLEFVRLMRMHTLTHNHKQAISLTAFGAPGADLPGIHTLRNVADADALLADAAKLKEAGGGKVWLCLFAGKMS